MCIAGCTLEILFFVTKCARVSACTHTRTPGEQFFFFFFLFFVFLFIVVVVVFFCFVFMRASTIKASPCISSSLQTGPNEPMIYATMSIGPSPCSETEV